MKQESEPELVLVEVEAEKTDKEKVMESYERINIKLDEILAKIRLRNSRLE